LLPICAASRTQQPVLGHELISGYDLYTSVGFQRNKRRFDAPLRKSSGINSWSFFVRALIGFTEHGRVI
jgi:hypothetical protein